MMKVKHDDWTIELFKVDNAAYGKGFFATAYVQKTDGRKACVRCFSDYSGVIKTQKAMLEMVKRYLAIRYE